MHRHLLTCLACLMVTFGPVVQAKPTNSATAAATAKKAAAEEAAAAKKAAEDAFVQKHYSALKANLPNLRESDVRGISKEDLKELYIKAYEASGMHMMEARQKAETVDLN